MKLELTVETQADRSKRPYELALDPELVFGRGPESVVPLDGTALSREHFALRREDGEVRLYDLSSNGTWHNGQRLGKGMWAAVETGSVIEIMGYRFELREIRSEGKAKEAPAAASPKPAAEETKPSARVWDMPAAFWRGFTGLEKTLLWVAGCGAALLWAYLASN